MPPQREIIAAITTSVSGTTTSAGWGTQIEEAEAEKKKQETEGEPPQKSTESENNASNEKQRKKIKRQAQKRKAQDNAKIEEENIVKRRFQQKELESAKERQEQMAKEHGIGIETTLNGEEKCGLHACADQTAEEKNSTKNRKQEKTNESASMPPQVGSEEKCGSQKCTSQIDKKDQHAVTEYRQARDLSSPPAWVLRCLAPWINSWSKNGRVATEKDHQFTAQKSIIVDGDKMVSSEIFAGYDKHVVTEVTIEQETRVACTLVQKIQEKNIEELRNIVQLFVAKNMPFAILAQTEIARKLKNKEVSFIHILRPFAFGNDIISQAKASWICG